MRPYDALGLTMTFGVSLGLGRGAFFLHQQAPPTIRRYAVLYYPIVAADNAAGYAPGDGRC